MSFNWPDRKLRGFWKKRCEKLALGSGQSETSVVISDGGWLRIIKLCQGGILVHLNETDPSSMVRLRPDVAVYLLNGAMFLKIEQ